MHLKNEIIKALKGIAHSRDLHAVFRDWVEMAAIAFANQIKTEYWQEREDAYLNITGNYKREELDKFCFCLSKLVLLFQEHGFNDWLGELFMEMEISNKDSGQFFTPYTLSQLMASMTISDEISLNKDDKKITLNEPAVGSGGIVLAAAERLHKLDVDYRERLSVTCVDVDLRCVHMAYIQLVLTGVPAVVVHGNTLTLEEHSCWVTPEYFRQSVNEKQKAAA